MKNISILFFTILIASILGCNHNKYDIIEAEADTVLLNYDTTSIQSIEKKSDDTISLIKGNCFSLSNLSGSGLDQEQYKRVISFSANNNSCTCNIINATSNRIKGRELDGRSSGTWKISNDKLLINWKGYYESRRMGASDDNNDFIEDNTGKNLKLKREIIGEYKVQINYGVISLIFVSEIVKEAELDEFLYTLRSENEEREFAYKLPYNDNIIGLVFERVDCLNDVNKYLKRDFFPQKNQSDIQRDKWMEEYKRNHSCSDQESFDAGYDIARDQIGSGLLADADYLYRLTLNSGNRYNYYCFSKGVNQYIKDR